MWAWLRLDPGGRVWLAGQQLALVRLKSITLIPRHVDTRRCGSQSVTLFVGDLPCALCSALNGLSPVQP